MVDNRKYAGYLRDETLNAATAVKLREYAVKWAGSPTVNPEKMDRDPDSKKTGTRVAADT